MQTNMKVERHAAPLRQQVVRLLREDILEGILSPGSRLLESALCESYGVSRTVIREALRQLETESLITMVPNRGPIVTVLSRRDIESLYEVRRSLEGLAGELFALNASAEQAAAMAALIETMEADYLRGSVESREASKEEFYGLLLEGAGNPVLESSLRGIHTRIGLFRRYAFVDEERVAISMQELRRVVRAAAVDRDPVAARSACEHHIRLAGELAVIEYSKRVGADISV
jgi:DNA-binding GntR family transcriptional regulator